MLSTDDASKEGTMVFFGLALQLSWLIGLSTPRLRSARAKDLEILLLRRQLAILQRTQPRPLRLTRWEKLGLVAKLPTTMRERLREPLVLVTPETVLRWHRELVHRTWTFRRQRPPGRPQCPVPLARGPDQRSVHRRGVLGGILHDYSRQVA